MFGPCELEYEGRKYFGNVTLGEFHIFQYDGYVYLVNVEKKASCSISRRLADLIGRLAFDPSWLVPESVMLELRGLKLIAGEEGVPHDVPPSGKAIPPGKKAEFAVSSIALFVAQECNMRCVYCYGEGGEYGEKGMMSQSTALAAVDWLMENSKNSEKVNVSFFGGEPLLNFPVIKKVVSYARKRAGEKGKHVTFGITTNGSLLTDEIISFLQSEKIAPLISFDGPPEYQDRQRPFKDGRGSYAAVHANVQKMRGAFPRLLAKATLYGDTDPFRIKEGMEEAGFTTCLLSKASPVLGNAPDSGIPRAGSREQMLERLRSFNRREIDQLLATLRERKINKDSQPRLLPALIDAASAERRYHGCGIGKGMAGISANGDIYPCHRFAGQEEVRMGNIAHYRLEGPNDYHRATVDHLPVCRHCWARYYCGGGCFYHNQAHTGDTRRPDALDCTERRAMFEGLIHVACRLDDDDKVYLDEMQESEPGWHP